MPIDDAAELSPWQAQTLLPLLDFLARAVPADPVRWQQWRIARLAGGANNRLYRATGDKGEFAIKFTLRDARDRAGREYHALAALQRAGRAVLGPGEGRRVVRVVHRPRLKGGGAAGVGAGSGKPPSPSGTGS